MSVNIRLPNITAATQTGQLEQIRSYLYQLSGELQWALGTMESGGAAMVSEPGGNAAAAPPGEQEQQAMSSFNAIKSLIIKSAEIVNAYYETISGRLSGLYVAQSDFGTYQQETDLKIQGNSQGIQQNYTNIQRILTEIETINEIVVNAYIRSGELYTDDTGAPVYGLEIGQKNTVEGVEIFNKYARFTSGRLSFYDKNDTEVAFISDYRLYITNAEITGSLTLGRFLMDTTNGLAFNWIGG